MASCAQPENNRRSISSGRKAYFLNDMGPPVLISAVCNVVGVDALLQDCRAREKGHGSRITACFYKNVTFRDAFGGAGLIASMS